jgi:hypothetical protein
MAEHQAHTNLLGGAVETLQADTQLASTVLFSTGI